MAARAGCGSSQCRVGSRTPWWTARAALTSPAMPAAGIRWPIIDFTEPSTARRSPSTAGPNTWASVASSAASPAGVAVPWASSSPSASGAAGSSPAARQAARTARLCPPGSGLASAAVRPSPATPVPRTTAYTRSPSRSASASRLSTTTPVPSPISRPSAPRWNGRIRSLGESARNCANTLHRVTSWQWCTPPASTRSQRPPASSPTAWSTATSDDAQAASTVYAGPRRSSRLAIREAARLGTSPIADSGRSGPSRSVNASRTRASCPAVRSGSSSPRVRTSWCAVRTRWSSRTRPGVRYPPRPSTTPIRSRSGSRSGPPASAMAAAATCKAISWSGSVPDTELGMMPNRVGCTSASASTKPPRRQYSRSGAAGPEAADGS